MNMKYILLPLFLLSFTFGYSQSTLKGTVVNEAGEALEFAQVYLVGTTNGTTTDRDGKFELNEIENGNYVLEVVYVGFTTFNQEININGTEAFIDVKLMNQSFELQLVEILGRKNKGFRPDVTFAGTRTGASVEDLPQAISILNKEVIKDQGIFRLNEASENIAGVTNTRNGDAFTSRGFRVNLDYINGNRALVSPGFSNSIITTQYERVEFIKGPSAALFGNSSPGGVINAVTKKPLDVSRAGATITYGSFNRKRATADITGPITKDKKLLYRLNLSFEDSETFRDFTENKSLLFAPSISYLPTDKTRINIDIVGVMNNDQAGVNRGMPVLQEDIFALPISFNTAEPYDYRRSAQVYFTASGSHEFTKALSFNFSYTNSTFDSNFMETRSLNSFTSDGTQLIRSLNERLTQGRSDFVTAYFVGRFSTGFMKHEAVVGWDFYQSDFGFNNRVANGEVNGIPNLVFTDREVYNSITDLSIQLNTLATGGVNTSRYRGLYVQDLITAGKFKLLLGMRYENLDQAAGFGVNLKNSIENEVYLPRLGLTYKLNEKVNLYASYTEGFSPQIIPQTFTLAIIDEPFRPLISDQIEFGTKSKFFQGRVLAQLSFYNINRNGRIVGDPTVTGVIPRFIQVDDEVSRGAEFEVQGRVNSNFVLTANYAFNQVFLKEGAILESLSLENNNPSHTAGFWGKYSFNKGILKGLGLGLGGRYVGSSIIPSGVPNAVRPTIEFPSYITARAGVYYRINNFDISANLNNIFDERYFIGGLNAGRIFPGAPRNFLVSMGYSF